MAREINFGQVSNTCIFLLHVCLYVLYVFVRLCTCYIILFLCFIVLLYYYVLSCRLSSLYTYTLYILIVYCTLYTHILHTLHTYVYYTIYIGWDLRCFIVKSNDDLRQEICCIQLMKLCNEIFKDFGLSSQLYLKPYRIVSTGNNTGIVEYM